MLCREGPVWSGQLPHRAHAKGRRPGVRLASRRFRQETGVSRLQSAAFLTSCLSSGDRGNYGSRGAPSECIGKGCRGSARGRLRKRRASSRTSENSCSRALSRMMSAGRHNSPKAASVQFPAAPLPLSGSVSRTDRLQPGALRASPTISHRWRAPVQRPRAGLLGRDALSAVDRRRFGILVMRDGFVECPFAFWGSAGFFRRPLSQRPTERA